jgi:hypothetical protein
MKPDWLLKFFLDLQEPSKVFEACKNPEEPQRVANICPLKNPEGFLKSWRTHFSKSVFPPNVSKTEAPPNQQDDYMR